MNNYVKILDSNSNKCVIIDTSIMIPHMECYYIENDCLCVEEINGRTYSLGSIVSQSDKLEELV